MADGYESPSWLDRLVMRVERLPGPAWLFYLVLSLVGVGLLHIGRWLDGSLGDWPAKGTFDTAYLGLGLVFYHYLRTAAVSSFDIFSILLDPGVRDRCRHDITNTPRRPAVWLGLAGLLLGVSALLVDPVARGNASTSPFTLLVLFVFGYMNLAIFLVAFYQVVRQLRLVNEYHSTVESIDLLQPEPLHSFSRFTARVGLFLLGLVYYSILTDPSTMENPVWIGGTILFSGLALASFVLPLRGMHRRLLREKRRYEGVVARQIRQVVLDLERRTGSISEEDVDRLNKTMSLTVTMKETVGRLSTWPWRTETLRGFVSALLLPVVLWLITNALSRLIGF